MAYRSYSKSDAVATAEIALGDPSTIDFYSNLAIRAPRAGSSAIVPVILSGGSGTRLWPLSTQAQPKQFLPLTGENSLFREALARVQDPLVFSAPIVVASARHAELCASEMLDFVDPARLILEPCARNTAAAIAMAAAVARDLHGDDAQILVMPSDHVIRDVSAFQSAVKAGAAAARAGRLVTFGIEPTGPETGYGYIRTGDSLAEAAGVREVVRFVEKPHRELAESMVADGVHLWNAGIFLFRVDRLLNELARTAPAIARSAELAIARAGSAGLRILPDADILASCPSESIDYALMERADGLAVVPMSPGWSDVGSWDALAELAAQPVQIGPVTTVDCNGCYIRTDKIRVAALGVEDLIVVAAGDRLLIMPRGRSQDVKALIAAMEEPLN